MYSYSNTCCLQCRTVQVQCSFAGIFRQSMGARNRVGIGLSYRPARPHKLAEWIPWNRFLGSLKIRSQDDVGVGGGKQINYNYLCTKQYRVFTRTEVTVQIMYTLQATTH
jgi:hypothetical protein